MKGRNPTSKEKKHMDRVSQLGCIVCFLNGFYGVPSEIHHIEGKTKEGAHFKVLPLCYQHHREGSNNDTWVSRHPYKKEFTKRYGTEIELLELVNSMIKKD